jgi:hypothetical protein
MLSAPSAAASGNELKACVDAADAGQTLRDQGKLVEAREKFVTCARDACTSVVARQCTTWLDDMNRSLPTITIRASDGSGREVVDLQVTIDGQDNPQAAGGMAVSVNPGLHKLRFRHADVTLDQDVVVHAGEKLRAIEARFSPLPPVHTEGPPAPAPAAATVAPPVTDGGGFRFPLVAGVSLGVGVAAFAVTGVLVATASSDVNHMRGTCAGSCSPSQVDSVNTRITVANVSLVTGFVGIAAAAVSLLVANGHSSSTSQASMTFGLGPGSAAIAGTF